MPRSFNRSRFRSQINQARSRIRQIQQKRQRALQDYRRKLGDLDRAISSYNRAVREYNSRRRQHLNRLQSALATLQRKQSTNHGTFRASVDRLQQTYQRMDHSSQSRILAPEENYFLDSAELEAANSVELLNALFEPESTTVDPDWLPLQETAIEDELAVISEDLDSRWRGAVFSLHPRNPEATRHFCSSVREIFTTILEERAPDDEVRARVPSCAETPQGRPTRRSRLQYLLERKGLKDSDYVEFADQDVENILELFSTLNSGTHGTSGKFGVGALTVIKRRVEDGLLFLSRIAA